MTPIPVEQALTLLLQAIHPIEAVERLPLGLACGRISAHCAGPTASTTF